MSESYYHPEDKAWMAKRKAEWRNVKNNLNRISASQARGLKRQAHKYHQELFFHGTLNLAGEDSDLARFGTYPITGHGTYCSMLPVFRLWYHPQPEVLDLEELRDPFMRKGGSLRDTRERFFSWGSRFGQYYYSPDYGLMGGREPLALAFLCPEVDYEKEVLAENRTLRQKRCLHPSDTIAQCLTGTTIELMMDARYFPYSPGQYLWEHLSYAVEHYPHEVFPDGSSEPGDSWGERYRQGLLVVMAEVLSFEARTDASRRRVHTVAMVDQLINRYERKKFSDGLLALWDQAKQERTKLQALGTKWREFKREPADLEDYARRMSDVELPPEKQQERIEKWKLI